MTPEFYKKEIYPILGDISPSLTNIVNFLKNKDYTENFNPSVSEEYGFLFDIWEYEEDMLYYQPDEVINALISYLK